MVVQAIAQALNIWLPCSANNFLTIRKSSPKLNKFSKFDKLLIEIRLEIRHSSLKILPLPRMKFVLENSSIALTTRHVLSHFTAWRTRGLSTGSPVLLPIEEEPIATSGASLRREI